MSAKSASFVHLHNHSEYSLLDGAAPLVDAKGKPSEFIQTMAKMGYTALALTDHGNLFGAIEFYKSCRDVGIKPIIGIEAYMSPTTRFDKEQRLGESASHITLLSTNRKGYDNLLKLTSMAYLEGFHYKPRIDKEILARHSEGLIGFSGCLKGEIPTALRLGEDQKALDLAYMFESIFGKGRFFIELMDHGLPAQLAVNPKLIELAHKTGIPVVATNDCHYFKKEDHFAHDVLLCIGTGKKLTDEKRMKYGAPEFYYKPPEDMVKKFADIPEALKATLEIAEQCEMKIDFDQLLLPRYEVPVGETPESYLKGLCLEGLKKYRKENNDVYRQRLELELSVIQKMGFAPYFLIVWDFIHYAKKNGIPVGPGRGSGAGSLVAYSLGITMIDPIENGLLFERFLNPDRRSMPDLDIDFSDDGREHVIQYVKQKYGENCVAQIITFGSMLARGVVRDVGRVLDMPLPQVDKIANLIPRELGITIDGALGSVPELKELTKSDPEVGRLIELAKKLEGLKRHTGVHAAGTVIAAGDITSYTPLSKNNKDIITTQFDGETLGKLGLLKVDFLGLRTLTVIRDAVNLVRERHQPDFDIEKIPVDDAKTYALLARADALGIFQLESSGMRDLLRKLKPRNLSDITALISLYRPGPMGSGMLDDFVARRNDPSKIKYPHELTKPILEETHGVIVYQEQVMRISQVLAGFTPGQADGLRKAMGKKIMEELEKQRDNFVQGCAKNNIDKKLANTVFDLMAHFGGYGFNKSHASAYGLVSYQTAYLKANFPVEYMAAICTSEIGRSALAGKEAESKLVVYLNASQDMGIEVLPPDVQKSGPIFSVESPVGAPRSQIRFGLTAIKNVGEGAIESVINARKKDGPFESLEDFCSRVDTRLTNRKVLESLIKAGAFDSFSPLPKNQARARLFERIESALDSANKIKDDQEFSTQSLFGEEEMKMTRKIIGAGQDNSQAEWSETDILAGEKEVLGLYLSGHPLSRYKKEMQSYTTTSLGRMPESGIVRVAGHILSVRRMTTKRGNLMARFAMEDLEGEIEVLVFPKLFTPEVNQMLQMGAMVVVKGRLEVRDSGGGGEKTFLAEEIQPFLQVREKMARALTLSVNSQQLEGPVSQQLKEIFGKYPGLCRVHFLLKDHQDDSVILETKTGIKPTDSFIKDIEKVLGQNCWSFGKIEV